MHYKFKENHDRKLQAVKPLLQPGFQFFLVINTPWLTKKKIRPTILYKTPGIHVFAMLKCLLKLWSQLTTVRHNSSRVKKS